MPHRPRGLQPGVAATSGAHALRGGRPRLLHPLPWTRISHLCRSRRRRGDCRWRRAFERGRGLECRPGRRLHAHPLVYRGPALPLPRQRHAGRLPRANWRAPLRGAARPGHGGFTASLVAADGKVYASSEDGDVYVVKAGETFQVLATNAMNEVSWPRRPSPTERSSSARAHGWWRWEEGPPRSSAGAAERTRRC